MQKYENLGLVGEGSYGIVTKCRNRETGRIVAVKKFLESEDDKTVKKIAQREVRLLKQLKHENLVNLLEVWKKKRRWYLVFEFVERSVLDELEQFPNGLQPRRVRSYLYQILRAIAFCHQHNIVHRDIKPENVLVSQDGVIKVCDFGFARVMSSVPGETYTDYVATRWYRAPELLLGDTKYDKAVDVWAIGCLCVEMITGVPLCPGDSDIDQLSRIIRCFGSLTPRHQQLFCRIFCGVSMPDATNREPLHTRFPNSRATPPTSHRNVCRWTQRKDPPCSQLLTHDLFTSDGFHIRFTLGSASVSNGDRDGIIRRSRDDLMQKTNSDIIQKEKLQCPTEERNVDHKQKPGPHDSNGRLLPVVEGGVTQEGNCGALPDRRGGANQDGRIGDMRDGRGGANQDGKIGDMRDGRGRAMQDRGGAMQDRGGAMQDRGGERPSSPMTTKTSLEDSHRPSETTTAAASRPPELPPRTCPGAGMSSIPPIMTSAGSSSMAPTLVPSSPRYPAAPGTSASVLAGLAETDTD